MVNGYRRRECRCAVRVCHLRIETWKGRGEREWRRGGRALHSRRVEGKGRCSSANCVCICPAQGMEVRRHLYVSCTANLVALTRPVTRPHPFPTLIHKKIAGRSIRRKLKWLFLRSSVIVEGKGRAWKFNPGPATGLCIDYHYRQLPIGAQVRYTSTRTLPDCPFAPADARPKR